MLKRSASGRLASDDDATIAKKGSGMTPSMTEKPRVFPWVPPPVEKTAQVGGLNQEIPVKDMTDEQRLNAAYSILCLRKTGLLVLTEGEALTWLSRLVER